ncbi:MAG: radical SAM protein [Clostridiales bacterium]|nr:radical SAM protein [Clostridiales bacterium]
MTAKRNIIPVFVPHLGCPNDCVFCNQRKISGSLVPATAETVASAVKEGIRKIPPNTNTQLAFYGGSFTAIPVSEQNELLNAALPFLRDGSISSLRLSTRPDAIDTQTLARLKSFGVRTIELGAQSMCNEVLKASGRGHTAEQTERASHLVKEEGFELILQMMTGLPQDTKKRTEETAERIISLRPDGVRIYPTVIVKDTPLFEMWRSGVYKEHTVEEAADWCALIVPMFEAAGIPVIRLGLNPTEELSRGAAAGGAYHPALGELVRSHILLDRARELIKNTAHGENLVIGVNRADISAMIGQHRANIDALCREFSLKSLKVRQADVKKGSLILM